jgi:hypothetical protein
LEVDEETNMIGWKVDPYVLWNKCNLKVLRKVYDCFVNDCDKKGKMFISMKHCWRNCYQEVEDAIEECKKTLAGRNDTPLIDRVKKMVVAFAKIGVTQEQIEKRLKKKIDTMNADDFVEYTGIYNAIKQGESKIAEWFESDPIASDLTNELKGDVL